MEGEKEKNTVIAMVSDPAVTLYGFIKFLKDCIMKLIFATWSKMSSIGEKFKVCWNGSSKNIVHSLLVRFITSFVEILSDQSTNFEVTQ